MPDAGDGAVVEDGKRAEHARLTEEVAALRAELAAASVRAELQGLRAAAQAGQAAALRDQAAMIQKSFFWRLTLPARLAVEIARGLPLTGSPEAQMLRRFLGLTRRHGLRVALQRARTRLRTEEARVTPAPAAGAGEKVAPSAILAPLVLIIAELTLPQCAKYRVWQKQEHFERLGYRVRVVDWRDLLECYAAAAVATQVILYRVPGFPLQMEMIRTLHGYGLPVAWEVDDLIFDRDLFLRSRNLEELDPDTREGLIEGVGLYRLAMLEAGAGIASTEPLAAEMRRAGLRNVRVVENALDVETLEAAARVRATRQRRDGVTIGYGSGTKTHDADFREAAPALLRLLGERPEVRLRVVGDLNLDPGFAAFGDRVERLPPTHYVRFLELLGACDISIAPLEPTLFNDAKSNIKFLEAAILGLPSVCSPAANFAAVIRHRQNGYLARTEAEWHAALSALIDDGELRRRIGQVACETVLARYAPEAVAREQAANLVAPVADVTPKALSVLFANVYFPPRRYGGATLVVDEMARRFAARGDTRVSIFTTLDGRDEPRALRRWQDEGLTVFAVPVQSGDVVADFDDPLVGAEFGHVLDAVRPDVVHLHALQWLSSSLANACRARGIPYVITVHDAWWLCARQFMVRADGTYCHQTRIDLRVCQACVPNARHLDARRTVLDAALAGAAAVLSPSEAHRQLHIANGVPADRIETAPNGVRLPPPGFARRRTGPLRFAYVGGNVDIKGYTVVRRAFELVPAGEWELVLVDNTLNLGFSSVNADDWRIKGGLRVVPAYAQEEMDAFFAEVDVLVFPSQWKESFGLTVREALARDVWVVATAGGGPGEAIVEGVNGNLIPLDGRHDTLAAVLRGLVEQPAAARDFVNPLKSAILDYDAQAAALHARLSQIARTAREHAA